MFVMYVVGVPLATAWLLWTNRQLVREKLGDDSTKLALVLEGVRTASKEVYAALEPVDRTTIYQTQQTSVNDNKSQTPDIHPLAASATRTATCTQPTLPSRPASQQTTVNDNDSQPPDTRGIDEQNVVCDPSSDVKVPPPQPPSSNGLNRADIFEINYGFLFLGFKPRSYYWEIVIMVRKALLSGFAVAFESDLRLQV